MKRVLFSWIGNADLDAEVRKNLGPVGAALDTFDYDRVELLSDWNESKNRRYSKWLRSKSGIPVKVHRVDLRAPTDFGGVYGGARRVLSKFFSENSGQWDVDFHISPGTPVMGAVWVILSKTRFPANLIESSTGKGVSRVSLPFDISAEFLGDIVRGSDESLEKLAASPLPDSPSFEKIIYKCQAMRREVDRANKVAPRNISVLLLGESGTGKELFANAIHNSSLRKDEPFVALNCGAIPPGLEESELFGHKKGAFTGAVANRNRRNKRNAFVFNFGDNLRID